MTHRLHYVYLAAILVLYLGFHNSYRTEYIDDSWTLSWVYAAWLKGVYIDEIAGYGKFAGTTLFSRGTVYVYGFLCDLFGWTRGVGYVVSTALLLAATAIWYGILRKLGYQRELCIWFVLMLLPMEAFFGMGHKIRVDALTFFLSTSAFFLFLHRRHFISGLLILVSFENHVMGVIAFFYIFGYLISIRHDVLKNPREYLKYFLAFIGGCVVGLGYYLAIHGEYLYIFTELLSERSGGNAIISYYFLMKYSWRHIPELIAIILAFGWFLYKRHYQKDHFILPFFLCCFLSAFLLPRGNYHYMIYIYPSAILLLLYTFDHQKLLNLFLIAFLLFQLPQYGYLFWKQREFDHEKHIEALKKHVPNEDIFLYGNPNAWFAFQDRNFHVYGYWGKKGAGLVDYPQEFILIENREFRDTGGLMRLNKTTECCYEVREVSEFPDYTGAPIRIKRYLRTESQPKPTGS